MKWKFHFATDIPGNRSIYQAEQVEASGYRREKTSKTRRESAGARCGYQIRFRKCPCGNPMEIPFLQTPHAGHSSQAPPYSEFGHNFHPLKNLKYGENFAYEVATNFYAMVVKKKIQPKYFGISKRKFGSFDESNRKSTNTRKYSI